MTYTNDAGLIELREEIAIYLKRKFSLHYDPQSEILVTVGSGEAIDLTMRILINPGDDILIPEPTFVSYAPLIRAQGGNPIPIPLRASNGFKLTAEQIQSTITPQTKAILLCYPSNPTGAIMTLPDYQAIAQTIIDHDLIAITDEIYAELTYNGVHCSIATLPGMEDRTIVISGLGKAFSMTGWRIGYVCAHVDFISAMLRVHQYGAMCAPIHSQWAAIEALRNGELAMLAMKEEYNQRRLLFVQGLNQIGLHCLLPEGAFYAFPSIQSTGMSSYEFALRAFQEAKVGVVPGHAFGMGGEGYIRASYVASRDQLNRALDRLDSWLLQARLV